MTPLTFTVRVAGEEVSELGQAGEVLDAMTLYWKPEKSISMLETVNDEVVTPE